ncbi:MAG: hypothetical protein IJ218_00235 [Alphaproteobacteria bacterium]|nr:hypothetical protein [Alphaproteobacteria bacterium]
MTEDVFLPDGMVRVADFIAHYRYVPQKTYEVTQAFAEMSDEEQIKVLKYIVRITNKRITFRSLEKPMTKKQFFQAMDKFTAKQKLYDSDVALIKPRKK